MIDVLLGSLTIFLLLLHGYLSALRANNLNESLRLEGEQMKINLDHVASAVIGLSDLLDDADGIIEDISKVPTTGEVIIDMLRTMIMSKIQPQISPFPDNAGFISQLLVPPDHGEGEKEQPPPE